MKIKRMFLLAVTLGTSFFAIFLAVSRTVLALPPGTIQARAEVRSTVDPAEPGIKGDLLLVENGAQQLFTLKVSSLPESDLYIYMCTNSFYDGTNSPVLTVAPLTRTSKKAWNWGRKLVGTTGAPLEFQVNGVANLSDMSDIRSIVIGNPGTTNIFGGTNYEDCVQIVTNNQTIISCTTNVVGGFTNLFINAFAWAPVPPLVADPSLSSFALKTTLQQPAIPPSPKAAGTLVLTYKGQKGESQMDVHISGLIKGQNYSLWISDGGSNVPSGNFVLSPNGDKGRLRRQTKAGEPLPLQAASSASLTDRTFTVRDSSGSIHLQGNF
jgi:hypothetical protein